MSRSKRMHKLFWLACFLVLPQFGACVTTNQLKDFVRTEIAVVTTQLISAPVSSALFDLAGPQVVEEIVPSI